MSSPPELTRAEAIEHILTDAEHERMRAVLSWKYLLERGEYPTRNHLRQYVKTAGVVSGLSFRCSTTAPSVGQDFFAVFLGGCLWNRQNLLGGLLEALKRRELM